MKRNIAHSTAAKTAAIFLAVICACLTFAMAFGVVVMFKAGVYVTPLEQLKTDLFERYAVERVYVVNDALTLGIDVSDYFTDTNFYFSIVTSTGETGISTVPEQILSSEPTVSVDFLDYFVYGYIDESLPKNDEIAVASRLLEKAYNFRYGAIAVGTSSAIVFITLMVYLCCAAGHRSGVEGLSLPAAGRIPFDVLTAIMVIIWLVQVEILASIFSPYSGYAAVAIMFVVDVTLSILYVMNLAIRVKLHNLISDMAVYRLFRAIRRLLKKAGRAAAFIAGKLPLVWKTALGFAVLSFVEIDMLLSWGNYHGPVVAFILLERIVLFPLLIFSAISLKKLQDGAQRIAAGELDYNIDTKYMYGDFKRSADDLNSINVGMQKAVDEKMRSERLKTELITNVSHDIKTPLTSIINYVDLIKKERVENENVKEYINVLDRQSGRLKKLIEDLVEASKASTGNLPLNLEPCDVDVLLDQAIAEYGDRLEAAGLELVMSKSLVPAMIMADGRHLWRIFDNLLNNVCKYAQPSTRVYIDVRREEEYAVITFRNISKSQLNISGEELMERFVRGDSSRNTEGSGLGLSIAKSLVELQNGSLQLTVDGDLFKISIKFKKMEGR